MNIAIINYQAGNANSVLHSFKKIGFEEGKQVQLVNHPSELNSDSLDNEFNSTKLDLIVLPGVGTALATMESLRSLGFIDVLEQKVIKDKVPFLGICIGYQIIFESSEESEDLGKKVPCMGWIKGQVRKFDKERVLVPQIGWNSCQLSSRHLRRDDFLIRRTSDDYFYFVNSYYATPEDEDIILYTTEYDKRFCSMLVKDNIAASQFHIEKSGQVGLKLLERVVAWSSNLQKDKKLC